MSDDDFARLAHAAMVEATVLRELANMGADAEGVADYLIERDVAGYRHHPESCPVALWLEESSADLGDAHVLSVDKDRVRVRTPGGDLSFTPTPGVSLFVTAFDNGEFPELDVEDDTELDEDDYYTEDNEDSE